MKETVTNSRISDCLEKMYGQLNKDMFNGELENVFITVQSAPNSYGHVTCDKIWKVKDTFEYEMNISAEYLNRPIVDVVATLLHEMVHIYNQMHNIRDCSRGMTYHNKKFKEKAESVGLVLEHGSRVGWSITKPSEKLIDYVADQQWSDLLVYRVGSASDVPKKKNSTRKYICPRCGMSVRATKTVHIKCADCDEVMTTA